MWMLSKDEKEALQKLTTEEMQTRYSRALYEGDFLREELAKRRLAKALEEERKTTRVNASCNDPKGDK